MIKKIKWLLCFSIILIAVNLNATDIELRIPDTTAVVNDIIDIPIYADSSLTGENVYSYQLQISFNSSYLNADSVLVAGTISEQFSISFNNSVSGVITIAAAGDVALSGTGVLLYIRFSALQNGFSPISFTSEENNFFNEGTPGIILTSGSINIYALPTIYVTPNSGLITIGDLLQFNVSGGTEPYQWSVTNISIASIDSSGMLTALGTGFTQVVAEDSAGIADTTNDFIEIRALELSIPDTTVMQDHTFNLPVYTTNISGLNISAGNFTLLYNANLLEAVDVITNGSLLSGYNAPIFDISNGQIEIAFAGSDTINGEGILLYIQMNTSLQYYGGTYIDFSNVLFNEDILATTQRGYCVINQLPTLNITPNTADLIAGDSLQFNVSGGTPPYEWTSSDTTVATINDNGLLFAIKSGVIIVSVIDSFGASDYSGNINIYDTQVIIPDTTGPVGLTYDLPIYIEELPAGQSVFSIEMTVSYKSPELEAIEVVNDGTLTDNWSFAQDVTSGQITFAGANASSFSSAGVMVKIKFQLTGELAIGEYAWVNIDDILLNEGIPLPWTINGSITGASAKPNPPENIIIYVESDSVHISWDTVPSVNSYKIYSSTDPYDLPSTWNLEGIVYPPATSWIKAISEIKKFYFVTAVRN